jgi:hypothetical protein
LGEKRQKRIGGMSICAMAGLTSIELSNAQVAGSKASITLSPKAKQGSDQRHRQLTISPDPKALPLLVRHQ